MRIDKLTYLTKWHNYAVRIIICNQRRIVWTDRYQFPSENTFIDFIYLQTSYVQFPMSPLPHGIAEHATARQCLICPGNCVL